MIQNFKFLKIGYVLSLVLLFVYSFTQIDLNLTLSRFPFWQIVEKNMQYIGFFNRPLSTAIYITILILLCYFYFSILFLAFKKKISVRNIWFFIISAAVILAFSYNAFSYDLFNYIFDAKILTFYHQNPFLHRPIDFTGDPLLHFMRWTHRYYPYGPSWLILTIPLSFIGMNFFLPTLFLFKLLAVFSYIGTCYLVYKISEKFTPENAIFNLVFWALNPLVLIEGLVSAHNDLPMAFFSLITFYFLLNQKYAGSIFYYLFSIGIKYATIVFLPVFIYVLYFNKRKKINWEKAFIVCVAVSLVAVAVATVRTTFQPWYLLYVLPFAALVSKKYYIFIPSVVSSFFGIVIYIPYVYLTDYNKLYPTVTFWIEISGAVLTIILTLIYMLKVSGKTKS